MKTKGVPSVSAQIVKSILAILPGGDCNGLGGCGHKTCKECAQAIGKEKNPALCPACKQTAINKIAKILGVPSVTTEEKVAFIACDGNAAGKNRAGNFKSCKDLKDAGFHRGECKSGCIGNGDCTKACNFGAMKLKDGKVSIDKKKCNGCGACTNTCPQALITLIPKDATTFIPCSSTEADDELVRKICGHGCISCGECERACPEGAVTIIDNHAVIDYEKCVGCVACSVKCRKKIIVDTAHDLTALKESVAFVNCNSDGKAAKKFKSMGITTCDKAALEDADALGLCSYGCLGQGKCSFVCRYDAIKVVNGVAVVNPDKCVGCRDCVHACPRQIISIVPYKGIKQVACSSKASAEERAKVCTSGCANCGDCKSNCPNLAIYDDKNHMVIDPEICEDCNVCQYVCPHKVIKQYDVPEYIFLQREALNKTEGGDL